MNLIHEFNQADDNVDRLLDICPDTFYTRPGIIYLTNSHQEIAEAIHTCCVSKNKKIIAFCDYKEAPNTPFLHFLKNLVTILTDQFGYSLNQFKYLSGFHPVKRNYEKLQKTFQQFDLPNITHENVNYWEREWQTIINSNTNLDQLENITNKPYRFLYLGGSPRAHRLLMLSFFIENKLLNQSLYSIIDDKQTLVGHCLKYAHPNNYVPIEDFLKAKDIIDFSKIIYPKYLTMQPGQHHKQHSLSLGELALFKSTYLSIITETSFFKNDSTEENIYNWHLDYSLICEKTLRSIACLHPFIVTTRPHSLKDLRELGYKTFTPYIDESYDEIENDYERLKHIQQIILELSKRSDEEWTKFCQNVYPIVKHNQNVLRSVGNR